MITDICENLNILNKNWTNSRDQKLTKSDKIKTNRSEVTGVDFSMKKRL